MEENKSEMERLNDSAYEKSKGKQEYAKVIEVDEASDSLSENLVLKVPTSNDIEEERYWVAVRIVIWAVDLINDTLGYNKRMATFVIYQHFPFGVYIIIVCSIFFSQLTLKTLLLSLGSAISMIVFAITFRMYFIHGKARTWNIISGVSYGVLNAGSVVCFYNDLHEEYASVTIVLITIWAVFLFFTNVGCSIVQLCIAFSIFAIEFIIRLFTCSLTSPFHEVNYKKLIPRTFSTKRVKYKDLNLCAYSCSVCCSNFNGDDNVVVLTCSPTHVFHVSCAISAFSKKPCCPVCSHCIDLK